MGVWGAKLYQNDIACDIKDEYLLRIGIGECEEDVLNSLIKEYDNVSYEDYHTFWLVIADILWDYGRLTDDIKKKAFEQIDLELREIVPKNLFLKNRKVALENLKSKLNTVQPAYRKIKTYKFTRSPFSVGDLLLFKITVPSVASDYKWNNKYVLFRVIGIGRTSVQDLPIDKYYNETTIFSLYNWVGEKDGPKDISKLSFFQKYSKDPYTFQQYIDDRFFVEFDFKKKDEKKFELLSHDLEYKKENIISTKNMLTSQIDRYIANNWDLRSIYHLGVPFYDEKVIYDDIIKALEKMEKEDNLVVEINS